eukprot:28224-Chlamydomonas_euryale.AAC.16
MRAPTLSGQHRATSRCLAGSGPRVVTHGPRRGLPRARVHPLAPHRVRLAHQGAIELPRPCR